MLPCVPASGCGQNNSLGCRFACKVGNVMSDDDFDVLGAVVGTISGEQIVYRPVLACPTSALNAQKVRKS